MSVKVKSNEKTNLKNSNKQFEIILKICLIIGIIIISGFIFYYISTPEPGYVTFGILNENQKAEDYPTEAAVNESVFFYVTVENHMKRDFSFHLEIFKGDNETILNSTGLFGAKSYFNTTTVHLNHKDFWMSNILNVSFLQPGANQRIIVILWEIPYSGIRRYVSSLYLWLEILP